MPLPDFDSLWDYDHPADTEAKFRQLLPAAGSSGDRAYQLELLTQIARAQGLQQKFDEAHATLDEVERLLTGDLTRPAIRYLLERGRVFNSSKNRPQARPLFLRAWELAQASGEDAHAVDAAHMLGIIEPPEEQLGWNLKALERAASSPQPKARKWLGSLYNNIGWTYHDAGEYEKALDTFQKALAWRTEQGQAAETRIARWCVARTLRSLNRLPEALAMQRDSLAEFEAIGETSGYVLEELGECLFALGRPDEARAFFAQAHAELSKDPWLADNEPARLQRLRELGEE